MVHPQQVSGVGLDFGGICTTAAALTQCPVKVTKQHSSPTQMLLLHSDGACGAGPFNAHNTQNVRKRI